jgi:hypothetical protein
LLLLLGRVLVPAWLEQTLGVALFLFILVDVFLTVLYARIGSGLLSYQLSRWIWQFFRRVSRLFGRHRAKALSFCGPIILVMVLLSWALLLTLGEALIIHPRLGTGVVSTTGVTPKDFVSALYAGGSSMSIVGANNFAPATSGFRALFMLDSLFGMSVISLTLTYLMQVYNALYRRNAFGYSVHLASAETGDAAELLAGIGPQGEYRSGYTSLAELSMQMTGLKESHHFYPVLFYFRFPDPAYAISRITLVLLDMVTLLKSALDDEHYAWLKESAPVTQLWRGCLILTTNLAETFLPDDLPSPNEPDYGTRERWRGRYHAAVRRLIQAGVPVTGDLSAGAENYIALRGHWQPHIENLAPALGFSMEEVDPAGTDPGSADRRPDFRSRLHTVG